VTSPATLERLGFGSASIGGLYAPLPEADAIETLQCAYEHGIRYFDTAPKYGNALAEDRIGKALAGLTRDSYQLSSKAGWDVFTDGRNPQPAFTRDGIRRSVEGTLQRLCTDYLDIVHLHDPDDHFEAAVRDAYPALVELKHEGVIGAIGVGVNQWPILNRFLDAAAFDAFMLAGRYTLLEQSALPLLDRCAAMGVEVNLGGVFNSGILATGVTPDAKHNYVSAPPEIRKRVAQIVATSSGYDVPLAAAAVQFGLMHPAVRRVVVGMRTPEEVRQNIRSFLHPIPGEFWARLQADRMIRADVPIKDQA
jgi:D-threo-aldose 1-dehydrogenase